MRLPVLVWAVVVALECSAAPRLRVFIPGSSQATNSGQQYVDIDHHEPGRRIEDYVRAALTVSKSPASVYTRPIVVLDWDGAIIDSADEVAADVANEIVPLIAITNLLTETAADDSLSPIRSVFALAQKQRGRSISSALGRYLPFCISHLAERMPPPKLPRGYARIHCRQTSGTRPGQLLYCMALHPSIAHTVDLFAQSGSGGVFMLAQAAMHRNSLCSSSVTETGGNAKACSETASVLSPEGDTVMQTVSRQFLQENCLGCPVKLISEYLQPREAAKLCKQNSQTDLLNFDGQCDGDRGTGLVDVAAAVIQHCRPSIILYQNADYDLHVNSSTCSLHRWERELRRTAIMGRGDYMLFAVESSLMELDLCLKGHGAHCAMLQRLRSLCKDGGLCSSDEAWPAGVIRKHSIYVRKGATFS